MAHVLFVLAKLCRAELLHLRDLHTELLLQLLHLAVWQNRWSVLPFSHSLSTLRTELTNLTVQKTPLRIMRLHDAVKLIAMLGDHLFPGLLCLQAVFIHHLRKPVLLCGQLLVHLLVQLLPVCLRHGVGNPQIRRDLGNR
jgi:hypothetical protein